MCGIVGIVSANANSIEAMVQAQEHRGPDHAGIFREGIIALGHNRLSILDLSTAANQPMISADGRYVLVFNGEIYNYRELATQWLCGKALKTSGDTEILLLLFAQMGKQCLPLLRGMFAFALYDCHEQTLFLARDRFGVKPLYYSQCKNDFYFASEIQAFWAVGLPRHPKLPVWAAYFAKGDYGQPQDTFWDNIWHLPAGHYLEVRLRNGKAEPGVPHRWYHFEDSIAGTEIPDNELEVVEAYKAVLNEAIMLRFRSDVPVGFTLSGGLDSSLLLGTVHRLFPAREQIRAFTFYCNHSQYDEIAYAQQLIKPTGKHHEMVLMRHSDVPELANRMNQVQGEPFGAFPTLAYSQLFRIARQQGYYVLLDGQGIDEAWAGYDYYLSNKETLVQGSVSSPVAPEVLLPHFAELHHAVPYPRPFASAVQNTQYRDLFYTKIPRVVRFNDRASMMWSVELREPFLDHRLVEFAFALPDRYKLRQGETKWLLRRIARSSMDASIAYAPKRPLQTPQREWLRHELREWAHSHISWLAGPGNPGWFDGRAMLSGWQQYLLQPIDNSFFVWQWINTALLLSQPPT